MTFKINRVRTCQINAKLDQSNMFGVINMVLLQKHYFLFSLVTTS